MIFKLRASSAPVFMACGGGGPLGPGQAVSETGDAADLGTAGHYILGRELAGHPVEWSDVATEYGVEKGELIGLCATGLRMWRDGLGDRHNKTTLRTEHWLAAPLRSDLNVFAHGTGHADVYSETLRTAFIDDWKFGYKDTSYRHQIRFYMGLALLMNDSLERAVGRVVWLRTQEIESYSMHRSELDAWQSEVFAAVNWDGVYHPGGHCTYCPRQSSCTARTAAERQALAVIGRDEVASADEVKATLAKMPDAELVQFLRLSKAIEKRAKLVTDTVRELVEERGEIKSGDGYVLRMADEERRSIDPVKAWPILQEALTDAELAGCLTLGAGKLDEAVAKKAPRGGGAEAKRNMTQKLIDAGALTKSITRKMVEKRE